MKHGIYVGSFDPFTLGHAAIVEQAAGLFDNITIVIGRNTAKKSFISEALRVATVQEWINNKNYNSFINVQLHNADFLVDIIKKYDNTILIRGIRNADDYNFEQSIFDVNHVLDPSAKSIFLFTPPQYRNISSSLVKSMIGFNKWEQRIESFVPPESIATLQKMMR